MKRRVSAILVALYAVACSSVPPHVPSPNPLFNMMGDVRDSNGYYLDPAWSGSSDDTCLNPYACNSDLNGGACNTQQLPGFGTDTAERSFLRSVLGGTTLHQTCEIAAHNGHFPGHVNVGIATYQGTLGWDGVSFDADYDLSLYTSRVGLTNSNPEFIHVEFDSDETLNQFDLPDGWWKLYRNASLRPDNSMDAVLGQRPNTVVTGLLGFDCEHDCHSELHPVYALAVREPATDGREHWAIMVRNWGTEGWCSSLNHTTGGRTMRILLPYGSVNAANEISIDNTLTWFRVYRSRGAGFIDRILLWLSHNRGRAAYYKPRVVSGGGAEMWFDLPDARERAVIVGEIVFKWPADVQESQLPAGGCKPINQFATPLPVVPEAESQFESLAAKLPASSRPPILVPSADVGGEKVIAQAEPEQGMDAGPHAMLIRVLPAEAAVPETRRDRAKLKDEARSAERVRQLCQAAKTQGLTNTSEYTYLCGKH